MKSLLLLLLSLCLARAQAVVRATWNASPSVIASYRLYFRDLTNSAPSFVQVPGSQLYAYVSNLTYGTTYRFWATAIASNDMESLPSASVDKLLLPKPPTLNMGEYLFTCGPVTLQQSTNYTVWRDAATNLFYFTLPMSGQTGTVNFYRVQSLGPVQIKAQP